jgi:ATP synthase protein I
MSAPDLQPEEQDALLASIRLRSERQRSWLRNGEDTVARRLAQIGVLGWITVIPMLIGILAGRWLDGRYHTGIFWTAPLLLLGATLGCWSAWRWVRNA